MVGVDIAKKLQWTRFVDYQGLYSPLDHPWRRFKINPYLNIKKALLKNRTFLFGCDNEIKILLKLFYVHDNIKIKGK